MRNILKILLMVAIAAPSMTGCYLHARTDVDHDSDDVRIRKSESSSMSSERSDSTTMPDSSYSRKSETKRSTEIETTP
jgi:hypothetical protein